MVWASAASRGSRPAAGASTSVQTPLVCTVSTTGQALVSPLADRPTMADSSRSKGTFCST